MIKVGIIKSYICDNCGAEMTIEDKILIYEISFWNKKEIKVERIDYILRRGIALMLCSKKCLGDHLIQLIEGD